jgi:hypothetical protein
MTLEQYQNMQFDRQHYDASKDTKGLNRPYDPDDEDKRCIEIINNRGVA